MQTSFFATLFQAVCTHVQFFAKDETFKFSTKTFPQKKITKVPQTSFTKKFHKKVSFPETFHEKFHKNISQKCFKKVSQRFHMYFHCCYQSKLTRALVVTRANPEHHTTGTIREDEASVTMQSMTEQKFQGYFTRGWAR